MAIIHMRVYGLLTGNERRKDNKTGLDYQKVTVTGEDGKKMEIKVMGPFNGLGNVKWGDRVTLDVDSPRLVMANYGDVLYQCAGVAVSDQKSQSAPLKAA